MVAERKKENRYFGTRKKKESRYFVRRKQGKTGTLCKKEGKKRGEIIREKWRVHTYMYKITEEGKNGGQVIEKGEEKESSLSRKERKRKAGYQERRGKRKQGIQKGEEKESRLLRKERTKKAGY